MGAIKCNSLNNNLIVLIVNNNFRENGFSESLLAWYAQQPMT
jgi:hypothetical protein